MAELTYAEQISAELQERMAYLETPAGWQEYLGETYPPVEGEPGWIGIPGAGFVPTAQYPTYEEAITAATGGAVTSIEQVKAQVAAAKAELALIPPGIPTPISVAREVSMVTNSITTPQTTDTASGLSAGGVPGVTEVGFPLAALGTMALGVFKALLAKYGPTILKLIIGTLAFKKFLELIGIGASDETTIPVKPGAKRRAKRYSIGANPRVGTLIKVAKRVDNLFNKYDTRVSKFRRRIKGPPRRYSHGYPMGAYLSPVERKQLSRGR